MVAVAYEGEGQDGSWQSRKEMRQRKKSETLEFQVKEGNQKGTNLCVSRT